MSKFINRLFHFLFPLIIIAIVFELLLRNIPNDYTYKRNYLLENSDSIQVLVLGSSHAYRAINPEYLDTRAFNAAYVSQTLEYDYRIWRAFSDKLVNLKCLILPISYFTLYSRLSTNVESWRVKNYSIYYGFFSYQLFENFEIFSDQPRYNIRRLISYYVNGENPITCSEKGWGRFKAYTKGNFEELGNAAIVRHTAKNNDWFGANSLILHKILRETAHRKVRVLLITLPVTEEYSAIMNEQQWNSTQREIYDVLSHFENVAYIDLLRDKRFEKVDFYDPDHLNEIGVRKLMAVVNVWCEKNL